MLSGSSKNRYCLPDIHVWNDWKFNLNYARSFQHTSTEKYDNNGKGWNFRLNYINKKSYKYIISITWNWMARCNTNNPTYCKENKEGNWDVRHHHIYRNTLPKLDNMIYFVSSDRRALRFICAGIWANKYWNNGLSYFQHTAFNETPIYYPTPSIKTISQEISVRIGVFSINQSSLKHWDLAVPYGDM